MLKQFIKHNKIIFTHDKEFSKLMIGMTIISFALSLSMYMMTDDWLAFAINLAPIIIYLVAYFGFYNPVFKKWEHEVRLESKYSYMYNRFVAKEFL